MKRRLSLASSWTPTLIKALDLCRQLCPRPAEEIAVLLQQNALTRVKFHPYGLVTAAQAVGLAHSVALDAWGATNGSLPRRGFRGRHAQLSTGVRAVYLRAAHTTTATAIILTRSVSEATQQEFSLTLRASPWWIAKIGGAGFLTRWFNPLNRPGGLGNPPHTINDAYASG